MSQTERPPHFPPVPELYTRTDYVPPPPVDAGSQTAPPPSESAAPVQSEPVRTAAAGTEQREKQPYQTFTGRVAAAPGFRTTKSQQLVATFPLAVHEARDGEVLTTYQRCVAFGKWAEKVRDTVQLGEELEVHGYKHEGKTKTGKPSVEYYVGAFKRPRGAAERG